VRGREGSEREGGKCMRGREGARLEGGRKVRGREGARLEGGRKVRGREVRGREGGEREGGILEHCSIYLMEWTGPDLPAVESLSDPLQREAGRNMGAHTHTHTCSSK